MVTRKQGISAIGLRNGGVNPLFTVGADAANAHEGEQA
jgi:hypothetical protein